MGCSHYLVAVYPVAENHFGVPLPCNRPVILTQGSTRGQGSVTRYFQKNDANINIGTRRENVRVGKLSRHLSGGGQLWFLNGRQCFPC